MDTRRNQWYAQLQFSGVAAPVNLEGSLMRIQADALRAMAEANPRLLVNGKGMILLFSDKPFGVTKAESNASTALELERLIDEPETSEDEDEHAPREGESQEDYVARMHRLYVNQALIELMVEKHYKESDN